MTDAVVIRLEDGRVSEASGSAVVLQLRVAAGQQGAEPAGSQQSARQTDSARPLRAAIEIAASIGRVNSGGWFVGVNRRGRVRWATVSRIVAFEIARRIAWKVVTNGSVWSYRLEPAGDVSRLVETRETPHEVYRFARWFTRRFLGGQRDHDAEL